MSGEQKATSQVAWRVRPGNTLRHVRQDWQLYVLIVPVLVFFAIFAYWPMYGIQIAFKEYLGPLGISGSPWVGFKHFLRFFNSFHFVRLMRNTLLSAGQDVDFSPHRPFYRLCLYP